MSEAAKRKLGLGRFHLLQANLGRIRAIRAVALAAGILHQRANQWVRATLLVVSHVPCLIQAQPQPLVISQVTVVNGEGPARAGLTVVIDHGRINAIGDSRQVKTPKNARVVDGTGQFLIPGLWDMHVHIALPSKKHPDGAYLPALVARGVTGVRDMGGSWELIAQRRKDISEGRLAGPRILAAGPFLDGPRETVLPFRITITNAAEARDAVQKVKKTGVDFVKVHDLLSREAYLAIVAEARRQRLPVAGHLPVAIRAEEAAEAGQKSIEHLGSLLGGLLMACSRREEELRAEYLDLIGKGHVSAAYRHSFEAATNVKMLDSYDPSKAMSLFGALRNNGVWQCPTLVINEANSKGSSNSTAEDKVQLSRLFQKQLALTNAMRQAGLHFLAGTDFAPGEGDFTVQNELSLLVQSGFTPQEALKTATVNPAKYLGLADSMGSVDKGKIADLVLLEANPLEAIGNTRKIAAVVVGGRLFLRPELDSMTTGPVK